MVLAACAALATLGSTQQWLDNFNSIDPGWVTDRYEPHGFSSSFFDGDNRLKIDIDPAESYGNRPGGYQSLFYNTQGRQRAAVVGLNWEAFGDVYVSEDYMSGEHLRRTDLWTRDANTNESNAQYPIFGVVRNDPNDPQNPGAAAIISRWRIWDGDIGSWVDLSSAVTGGWHHLSIRSTGSAFEYRLDGSLVHTDSTYSEAGFESLKTVFVQAYNFGDANFPTSQDAYAAYWDNIGTVPEPITLITLGCGVAVLIRRRKR